MFEDFEGIVQLKINLFFSLRNFYNNANRNFENSEDLAIALAGHIMGILKEKPNATMVLTSGNTPIAAYRHIAKTASKDLF
ncbi:MAG: hypothetical protein IPH28_06675 [Cytophagaceae bacterium]|nr:hypothetical protein [Cytophagaceae bacterium]